MTRRFQFSLKWPFVILAGMMAGGQTARWVALSETPMIGGAPVSWSAFGEAVFFSIGCLAAIAGMAGVVTLPSLLRVHRMAMRQQPPLIPDPVTLSSLLRLEPKWHVGKEWRQIVLSLIAALLIGSVAGFVGIVAIGWTFITVPQEVFDLLTT